MKVWAFAMVAAVAAMTVSGVAFGQVPAKKILCWTDNQGRRMCGDNIPPEYAGAKRDVIKDGRVVDTVKAARTPEEIAAAKRTQQAAEEATRQADYDRALLQTFRSAKDIESMRDERLALIDTRIQAAEKNSADTDHNLEGLRARVAALEKDSKPVEERLARQVHQFERAQKENSDALTRYRAERNDVTTKFNRDLERYSALRATMNPAKPAKPAKPATAGKKPG